MTDSITIKILQEQFLLLADRALYWPSEKALIIADLHLGKAQTFQKEGIAVPLGVMEEDLQRLSHMVTTHKVNQLIVLGDFTHHPSGLTSQVGSTLTAWLSHHSNVHVRVILGNHDRASRRLLSRFNLDVVENIVQLGPLSMAHDHTEHNHKEHAFILCGHTHPVIKVPQSTAGNVPVFAVYKHYAILPAFSLFTGGYRIKVEHTKQVYALAEKQIVQVK